MISQISFQKLKTNLILIDVVESLFLKDCCSIILKVKYQNRLISNLPINYKYLFGSKTGDNYIKFLIALEFATKKHFESSPRTSSENKR